MDEWLRYKKTGITEMRLYRVGENLDGVSVSDEDRENGELARPGGMIARDPKNPSDQWFVNQAFFEKNYVS